MIQRDMKKCFFFQTMVHNKAILAGYALCETGRVLLIAAAAFWAAIVVDDVFLQEMAPSETAPVLLMAAPSLLVLFLVLIFLYLLGFLLNYQQQELSYRARSLVREKLHEKILSSINIKGQAGGESIQMNNLLPLALEQVDALDLWFTKVLPVIFGLAIHLPILLIISAGTDPMTGLLMLITLPIAPFLLYLIDRVSRDASKKEWQELTELSAGLAELLHTLPTVKLFRQERRLTGMVACLSENFAQAALRVLQITFISAFALELITTLSIAIVAVSIGLRLLYGQLTFFTAFFVLLVLPEFYQPLRQAGTAFHGGMTAYTAETSLAEFLYSREVKAEANPAKDLAQEMGVIIGRHISFSYGAEALPVLLDRNFVVPAQQITVIRGSSGSGKTTLLRLCGGLLSPTKGILRRSRVPLSYVPQEPHLFNGTLAENITLVLATDSYSAEEQAKIRQALEKVQLLAWAEQLPQGMMTLLGEGGQNLSQGQRKRLGLARAIYQQRDFVLMDEPTAALDSATRAEIIKVLWELAQGRTLLLVSHDEDLLALADNIILLEPVEQNLEVQIETEEEEVL